MRGSHLTWLVASLLLLSGCGARSPFDDDDENSEITASGGALFGVGGYTTSIGGITGKGGSPTFGGTPSYGAMGGYGGIVGGYGGYVYGGGRGGAGGYGGTVGGRGGVGGVVYGGGVGGKPMGGSGGVAGKGGFAGTAGRGGGAGNAGRGGVAGSAGVVQGGTAGAGLVAGSPGNGGVAGNAGTIGDGAAGTSNTGGIVNAGGVGTGGANTGGVGTGGATTGIAGSTAGTSPGGAGPWQGCVCGETNCGTCPTTTVTVDRGSYVIDATETTNAEYTLFLSANVPIASQPAVCGWNLTFVPNVNWPIVGKDNMPVTWVDWCDAFAYCAWAGKRLCGSVGGGSAPFAESDDPGQNQWFDACTTGGTSIYPYGATYEPLTCNGADYGAEALVAAGTMANCKTPTGIYDMSGNAYEWEDSCGNWTGETDVCHTRGGSFFTSDANILRCRTASTLYTRNSVRSSIGFRCCADK